MKYSNFSSLKQKNIGFFRNLLKHFNLWPAFVYRKKAISYSDRASAGEDFLLRDFNFFPYSWYSSIKVSDTQDPLNQSTHLIASLSEFQYQFHIQKDNPAKTFEYITTENDARNYLSELFRIYKLNLSKPDDLSNLPVVVPARVLYAYSIFNVNTNNNDNDQEKEIINLIISKFISKLEFADVETISQVIYALNKLKIYDRNLWDPIVGALRTKKFAGEYTEVEIILPFLFRYVETSRETFFSKYFNRTERINRYENFFHKNKPVHETYLSLKEAAIYIQDYDILVKELERRFPFLVETPLESSF
jgi:hypothetical protein